MKRAKPSPVVPSPQSSEPIYITGIAVVDVLAEIEDGIELRRLAAEKLARIKPQERV
jgi:hypothetical protein